MKEPFTRKNRPQSELAASSILPTFWDSAKRNHEGWWEKRWMCVECG